MLTVIDDSLGRRMEGRRNMGEEIRGEVGVFMPKVKRLIWSIGGDRQVRLKKRELKKETGREMVDCRIRLVQAISLNYIIVGTVRASIHLTSIGIFFVPECYLEFQLT
jgi:hypothetical protein